MFPICFQEELYGFYDLSVLFVAGRIGKPDPGAGDHPSLKQVKLWVPRHTAMSNQSESELVIHVAIVVLAVFDRRDDADPNPWNVELKGC